MKPVWKDATAYSRGEERIPLWWEIEIGDTRISVGNWHIHYRDGQTWLMHAVGFSDPHVLKAETEEQAKHEALVLVRDRARRIANAIDEELSCG